MGSEAGNLSRGNPRATRFVEQGMEATVPVKRAVLALVLAAALSGMAQQAHAARQLNPLPVYTADNDRFELLYSRKGVLFEDRLYVQVSARRWRFEADPGADCPTDGPGRVVGELRMRAATIEHVWTEFEGCTKKRLPKLRETRRTFYRTRRDDAALCRRTTYTYGPVRGRKEARLRLTDRCDGTADVSIAGQPHTLRVSYASRARLDGYDTFMGDSPARWKLTIRGRIGAQKLTLRGKLRPLERGQRAQAVRGPWILLGSASAAPGSGLQPTR